jgi:hypothetical protein
LLRCCAENSKFSRLVLQGWLQSAPFSVFSFYAVLLLLLCLLALILQRTSSSAG